MVDNHTQMPQTLNHDTNAVFCWRIDLQAWFSARQADGMAEWTWTGLPNQAVKKEV
jgi:hypothetical protein